MIINVANSKTKIHIEQTTSLSFDIVINNDHEKSLYLTEDNFLAIKHIDKTMFIDFTDNDISQRINPKAKKCSVVQAVEGRSKESLSILDATAGLGRDSFTLASRGHHITAVEKDPYIYLILADAISRAKKTPQISEIATRISLLNLDSCKYIPNTSKAFDCIYLDPMFPTRRKSAKVKKQMQIMHHIAFDDGETNSQLFKSIINKKTTTKVIIKRPAKSEFLLNKKPSSQLIGKANRFDIYQL